MAYIAPIHEPTSVRHALKLNLLSLDEECLVVAKANRIEIYNQTSDGLTLFHTRAVYGKIAMLERLRPTNSQIEHLFVGTDRFMYFVISWDTQTRSLRTEQTYVDQTDKTARDSFNQDRCLLDPTNEFIALQIYDGIVIIFPIAGKDRRKAQLENKFLGEPVQIRISDLFVRSSAFLYPRKANEKPKMAFLYENSRQEVQFKIRQLNFTPGGTGDSGSADLEEMKRQHDLDVSPGATHLIPVPAPAYGILVLAETIITYYNDMSRRKLTKPLQDSVVFVAWENIDAQRWILADDYGRLYFFMLMLENSNVVSSWKIDMIGHTSRASVLVYLDGGYVFVGSHQGDSQVIKINERSIEVVQKLSNIAPILDLNIMDLGSRRGNSQINEYSSGQARIVTGSGAFQDGSLRSVRSGVGIEEHGLLGEMDHITELFSLRSTSSNKHVDLLVLSFIDETRVFYFNRDGEVEEKAEYQNLLLSEPTLLAANLRNNHILQITRSSVRVVDMENGIMVSQWSPSDGETITAASANLENLIISVGGIIIMVLELEKDLYVLTKKKFGNDQIACIHIPTFSSEFCIAGFWHSASIAILKLESLEIIQEIIISDEVVSVPRSILVSYLLAGQPPTLLVAMANGEVVTFSVSLDDFSLSAKKVVVLGTQQASLKLLPRSDGLANIFAICEQPSLIYSSDGRIVYSAVTAEKASCVCPFDSEAYPKAIAIATAEDLKIASVDTERTTHVQTLHMKESVRRVAYSTNLKAFGLGTIKRTLQDGNEIVQSSFKLVDEILFTALDSFAMEEEELVESVIRADLREHEDADTVVERFVVGTSFSEEKPKARVNGRILVFAVTPTRSLQLITELELRGSCRTLGVVDGNIVAGLVSTVAIFTLSSNTLQKVASYRTATAPIDLSVKDNLIAISDLMKSVTIVEYKRGVAGLPDTLTEIARHFQITWSTAVAHIADDTILEADAEGNLMMLHRNTNGVTEDDRRRLEVTSEIRLGEMVNRIRSFEVPTSVNTAVVPRAFIGTVEGSIYLFALILPAAQDLLMRLQDALAPLVPSLGNIPFHGYRAFSNQVRQADEPFRFVDGELVEKFLGMSDEVQGSIVKGLGVGTGDLDVESVRAMVEGLRRLR